MCDVLRSNTGVEDVANVHAFHTLSIFIPIVHVNGAIKYDEYFLAVIRVPLVVVYPSNAVAW
jgi:hypothetical protein